MIDRPRPFLPLGRATKLATARAGAISSRRLAESGMKIACHGFLSFDVYGLNEVVSRA